MSWAPAMLAMGMQECKHLLHSLACRAAGQERGAAEGRLPLRLLALRQRAARAGGRRVRGRARARGVLRPGSPPLCRHAPGDTPLP